MTEPIVEHKNSPRTPMQRMELMLAIQTQKAREMLHVLEKTLVRCGYVRDAIYNSRLENFTSSSCRGVVIYWQKGRILWGNGFSPKVKGEPRKACPPTGVDDMSAEHLVRVAEHLSPFVDCLEGRTRHLCERLAESVGILEAMIGKIQDDPRPPAS